MAAGGLLAQYRQLYSRMDQAWQRWCDLQVWHSPGFTFHRSEAQHAATGIVGVSRLRKCPLSLHTGGRYRGEPGRFLTCPAPKVALPRISPVPTDTLAASPLCRNSPFGWSAHASPSSSASRCLSASLTLTLTKPTNLVPCIAQRACLGTSQVTHEGLQLPTFTGTVISDGTARGPC